MRSKLTFISSLMFAWLLAMLTTNPVYAADLVVVMDDLGNNFGRDRQVLELPGQVTLALLPFAPHSARMALLADEFGKEVILHQPMQSQREHRRDEHGNLRLDMSDAEFEDTLTQSLAAIPNIVGINNHTGSLLTEHHKPMTRVMQALQQSGLFFLDSRTTPNTVATDVANEMGVPALSRDVFLDNHRDPESIHIQFERAIRIARKSGHAILIAHPYPESFDYLYEALYNLPSDVQLTSLSNVMPNATLRIQEEPIQERPIPELIKALPNLEHQIALVQPEDPASLHKSLGR
jgi:polysaccharide deacetylase 2 family uncharacterized protein YibQ